VDVVDEAPHGRGALLARQQSEPQRE